MAWFKKFVEEVKTEWKRINTIEEKAIEENKQQELEESKVNEIKHHIANKIALANIGIERYGRPTITFKGKSYNAKTLLKLVEHKDNLTTDDMIMCEMMIFKINEQIDEIAKRDEYGNILRDTDDAVLDAYLMFAKNELIRLKWSLEKAK